MLMIRNQNVMYVTVSRLDNRDSAVSASSRVRLLDGRLLRRSRPDARDTSQEYHVKYCKPTVRFSVDGEVAP